MAAFERSWVEIDAARLAANLRAVQSAAGDATEVLAVVKADAYGHGAELCAPILARAGARWFGVTDAAEGVRVRRALERAGFGSAEILVMCGSLPEEFYAIAQSGLTPVVWTPEQVRALAGLTQAKVHIEIDTGMGRQGARVGAELDAVLAAVRNAGLKLDGLFTHLCSSEVAHSPVTMLQKERFEQVVNQVRRFGMEPGLLHIANSSAVDNPADVSRWLSMLARSVGARAMVRAGLALYGYVLPLAQPGHEDGEDSAHGELGPQLQTVLTWKARVLAVHDLRVGETVGYGATFTAAQAMRVALLPVGYADGLRRELSNPGTRSSEAAGGWVTAHGPGGVPQPCAIVGRVSMNLLVVDVSAALWLAASDVVTLLGEGNTAADHARIAGTIPYEILCALRSNPHIVVNES